MMREEGRDGLRGYLSPVWRRISIPERFNLIDSADREWVVVRGV